MCRATTSVAHAMVGTRSLSSGARSRDPVALPTLRQRHEPEGIAVALDVTGTEVPADHQCRRVGEA